VRVHPPQVIQRTKKLRKEGNSVNEIVRLVGIPKTTVWHYIHNIQIAPDLKKKLISNQGGSRARKKLSLAKAQEHATMLLSGEWANDASMLAMLYWAEGNKDELTFTNTDEKMIRLFIDLLKKCLSVAPERVVIAIRYFTGMNRRNCFQFWSKCTGVPKQRVRMYYNDGGSVGRTPYGICRVLVKKGAQEFKVIQALIRQIAG
jgi:hypothetical protein